MSESDPDPRSRCHLPGWQPRPEEQHRASQQIRTSVLTDHPKRLRQISGPSRHLVVGDPTPAGPGQFKPGDHLSRP